MAVRPIDGNELIEWFRPYLHTGEPIPSEVVIEDIRSMPTLTPPNEWVSVEERLPEEKQRVIVRCERVGTSVGWILWGNWMTDIGPGAGKVTHWMPLPAPPDKGNNVPIQAPNDPLTQADLDSMDYDKVWIDYEDGTGEWALVCKGYIYSIDTLEGAGLDFVDYMRGEKLEPHGYKVYRRPPEEET